MTSTQVLLSRLGTGRWQVPPPARLNAGATALGPRFNQLPAEFTSYQPAQFPRPFNLFHFRGGRPHA